MAKKVALLDAGAQLEKVIMRRVLEQGYNIDKFPVNVQTYVLKDYDAIIISGGPRSVNDFDALLPNINIYSLCKPIFGICYGFQAIAHQLGGKVVNGERGQYGRTILDIIKHDDIFSGLSTQERVLMSHFDIVEEIPKGFEIYGYSEGQIAAFGNKQRRIYATQFHPEMIPVTKNGYKIFQNFFHKICDFPQSASKTIREEIENAKKTIMETVGSNNHVMHYLSGGVDSTVMAILLSKCIEPERLHIRTLDTGTMRIGEVEEVNEIAKNLSLPNFKILDVRNRFYNAKHVITTKEGKILAGPLCYTTDPEYKRKLFGTEYALIAITEMINLARETNLSLDNFFLGQGTLRPDVIESGDKRVTKGEAHTIKTHHNAVEALKNIQKVEPLIELFKDQVRKIAMEFGLPEQFAYRQPYPGPGLYCRIIGRKNSIIDSDFFRLDKKVIGITRRYGFNAHVLPIKTVGVQGDERSYKPPVIVSGEVDWNDYARLTLELPNEINEINRVLYTPESLTLEEIISITPTLMTQDVINQAQEADLIMRRIADQYGYNDSRKCSQMPGILIPCNFGKCGKRSFVIRPVFTYDFMAVIGMIPYSVKPKRDLEEFFPEEMFFQMVDEIPKKVEGISRIILDPNDKPPASTEWE